MQRRARILIFAALLFSCLCVLLISRSLASQPDRVAAVTITAAPTSRSTTDSFATTTAGFTATSTTDSRAQAANTATGSNLVTSSADGRTTRPAVDSETPATATATFTNTATSVPTGFLGISLEYWEIPRLATNSGLLAKVVNLLRPTPGATFYIRIGGDSADDTVWAPGKQKTPAWAYRIDRRWLRSLQTIVSVTHAKLIVDLNLYDEDPSGAAAQASAILKALPAGTVADFEIGNEPDLYGTGNTLRTPIGRRREQTAAQTQAQDAATDSYYARLKGFTATEYAHWYKLYRDALTKVAPQITLAGPALSNPDHAAAWVKPLLALPDNHLRLITIHHYPLNNCLPASSSDYPTVGRILAWKNATNKATESAVQLATSAGLQVRLTEINSVTCGGNRHVSTTFATALWVLNTLFSYLQDGVSGVNLHVRTYAVNAPFGITDSHLRPKSLLYGLTLFSRAIVPDATLLDTHLQSAYQDLHVWGLRSGQDQRFLAVNTGARDVTMRLRIPANGMLIAQQLTAPSVRSGFGVQLAGQQLNDLALWHGPMVTLEYSPAASNDGYLVTVPRYSAVLFTH